MREDIGRQVDLPPSNAPVVLAAGISVALAFMAISGPVLRPYFHGEPFASVPYSRAALLTLFDLGVMGAVLVLAGRKWSDLTALSGVFAPVARPVVFACLVLTPGIAACVLYARFAQDLTGPGIAWTVFGAPFFEEVIARGLAVGALIRLCGWPLWAACLWPAAFFGAAHFWQGETPLEIAGVVAITGLGGLLFGWLYVRWGFNIWPPVFLHVGLNGLWTFFSLGDNALGGEFGNIVRFGTVALAILVTLLMTQRTQTGAA
jgi:uncharacterized protein